MTNSVYITMDGTHPDLEIQSGALHHHFWSPTWEMNISM